MILCTHPHHFAICAAPLAVLASTFDVNENNMPCQYNSSAAAAASAAAMGSRP